ncbi:MAG: methylated-DNA--[protein]-cysteine S-methyltransferase [Sedimentisphaerales bacterium]|nr:methylated-DNA--[protein]-cysteine S-methyltransferase [Sedimentisphaerales bacterium]
MSIIFVTSKPSANTEYRYAPVKTCWGSLAFVCRDSLVCRLFFGFSKPRHLSTEIKNHFPTACLDNSLLKGLQRDLADYFHGQHVEFNCGIDLSWAGDFTNRVLRRCSRLKPAETMSYKELAKQIGSPRAARAVGNALSKNRIPLIIPCHRIITSNDSPGGFSAPGGINLKKRLIEHEARMTKGII